MATIIYGSKETAKNMGYLGEEETCGTCGRTYKKALMKYTKWFHIYYIPLIPYKTTFSRMEAAKIASFWKTTPNFRRSSSRSQVRTSFPSTNTCPSPGS